MKVFYSTTFNGHWPVGVAAVVVASDSKFAAKRLEIELKKQGLEQEIKPESLIEIDLYDPKVYMLNNGDY
jgi:hypothetical protein